MAALSSSPSPAATAARSSAACASDSGRRWPAAAACSSISCHVFQVLVDARLRLVELAARPSARPWPARRRSARAWPAPARETCRARCRAARRTPGLRPARRGSSPSTRLVASLARAPMPAPPTTMRLGASACSNVARGAAAPRDRRRAASWPRPAAICWLEPDSGASMKSTPRAPGAPASACNASGSPVEQSISARTAPAAEQPPAFDDLEHAGGVEHGEHDARAACAEFGQRRGHAATGRRKVRTALGRGDRSRAA